MQTCHHHNLCKKRQRHQKPFQVLSPVSIWHSRVLQGSEWPFVYKGKAFWLEWMLSSGRGHFLASILPSSIEIGTWPPKVVNDTSPYWRHPTFPLVAMTTWSKTESYETHLNIFSNLGHSVAIVTPDPLLSLHLKKVLRLTIFLSTHFEKNLSPPGN